MFQCGFFINRLGTDGAKKDAHLQMVVTKDMNIWVASKNFCPRSCLTLIEVYIVRLTKEIIVFHTHSFK